MSVKIRIQRPFLQGAKPRSFAAEAPVEAARLRPAAVPANRPAERSFSATLADCAGAQRIDALKNQRVQRTRSARVERQSVPARPATTSPLIRAFGWLRSKCAQAADKQLRVAETVSLGEKRFVAIIHADGRKFLVGGGAQGVALLTQLGALTDAGEAHPSLVEFAEHSA